MKTIKELLKTDKRTDGFKIVDENTVIIKNSVPYPLWTEAQQFLGIIEMNWGRGDIIESIDDVFASETKIRFKVGVDEEIEAKEAI
jgi:hypothetical protein